MSALGDPLAHLARPVRSAWADPLHVLPHGQPSNQWLPCGPCRWVGSGKAVKDGLRESDGGGGGIWRVGVWFGGVGWRCHSGSGRRGSFCDRRHSRAFVLFSGALGGPHVPASQPLPASLATEFQ